MPLLESLAGLDQSSLLVGLFLGFVFATFSALVVKWARWTRGMLTRPLAARQDIEELEGEIGEVREESWTDFRTGIKVGCVRVVVYLLLAIIAARCILSVWRMSTP